jgi:pilus assembly protein CpaE
MYDYVVVDTPAQFSEPVLIAMDASAHHVLLTTPDVPALKNLRVTLDTFDMLSYPADIRSIVLNRSDAKVGLTAEDVARVVRTPIAAQVPSSREVPVSINKGTPIVLDNPAHPVSQAISRFARDRLQVGVPVSDRSAAPAGRRVVGRRSK